MNDDLKNAEIYLEEAKTQLRFADNEHNLKNAVFHLQQAVEFAI